MNASRLKCRSEGSRHPDWERLYAEEPVTRLPWYLAALDPDLRQALKGHPPRGQRFLDIGTGPGTQAGILAGMGYSVVATDLSPTAVRLAAAQVRDVRFVQDDITRTRLEESFEFVIDRGCFHVLSTDDQPNYVDNVARLTAPGGRLFLKCFSAEEPGRDFGPLTFSPATIVGLFEKHFRLEEARSTRYHGEKGPRSLFCTLKRRG